MYLFVFIDDTGYMVYPILDGRLVNFNTPFFTIGVPGFVNLYIASVILFIATLYLRQKTAWIS